MTMPSALSGRDRVVGKGEDSGEGEVATEGEVKRATAGVGLASPKSMSLAPDLVSMMLSGLRSRWMTPLR